ncbi:MAG: hypothetical protein HY645_04575 [Acidobacteria bacterium]|nr:hypothetical protein [Acidobacteriota bacterium]
MQRSGLKRAVYICIVLLLIGEDFLYSWGALGHRLITGMAVDYSRGEYRAALMRHRNYLIDHSMDADHRKETDPNESVRHFVDLDRYGPFPFNEFSLDFRILSRKLGEQRVKKNGVLLWAIEESYRNLVRAFEKHDPQAIRRYLSDVAHYVADLHQPLHTTENYDGQLSGQEGIHYRFEYELVSSLLPVISFSPDPPQDLGSVLPSLYQFALDSYVCVDDILRADQRAVEQLKINRKEYERTKGEKRKPYPVPYYALLEKELGLLLKERMNKAVFALSSLWMMAWQAAGRPSF